MRALSPVRPSAFADNVVEVPLDILNKSMGRCSGTARWDSKVSHLDIAA
jgi:hypothetical protein